MRSRWIPFRTLVVAMFVLSVAVVAFAAGPPRLLKDICKDGCDSWPARTSSYWYPGSYTRMGNQVFFVATDYAVPLGPPVGADVHGYELWKTDGTPAGTMMVADVLPGPSSSYPQYLTNVNGTLYFVGLGSGASELWKSDGTAAGAVQLTTCPTGGECVLSSLTGVGSTLFFLHQSFGGHAIWKTDGTSAGTQKLANISYPISEPRVPFASLNGSAYFIGDCDHTVTGGPTYCPAPSGVYQPWALWKSDGTTAGTGTVPIGMTPFPLVPAVVSGGKIFMIQYPLPGGVVELWSSDGTASGTVLLKTFSGTYTAGLMTPPPWLTDVNGTLFLLASDGTGLRLWKSDGTPGGTIALSFVLGAGGNLTNVNGTLYFYTNDSTNGNRLWKSDGTAAGTLPVCTGMWVSYPDNFTPLQNEVFFTADGKLWTVDSTPQGAHVVTNPNPDPGTGFLNPTNLVNGGNFLMFEAQSEWYGIEPYVIIPAPPGDANGDGQVTVSDVFYEINSLFAGGPAPANGDANGDGLVTVADVFYLINYLFANGPAPH